MAPIPNHRLLFNSVPVGYPVLGETFVFDKNTTIDLEDPKLVPAGSALVKTILLSVDPYMRLSMPVLPIGEPLTGYGIGEVLKSNDPKVKPGDRIYGFFNFQKYSVIDLSIPAPSDYRVIKNEENLPWSLYVGVLGMPGKTAYYGYKEFAQKNRVYPQPEKETLFITTAAGPTGATVVQLAKVDGKKVIASAGSEDKIAFIKEIGGDVAFNYKTTKTEDILKEHGPIDIYWDHAGGEQLETSITNMNQNGRIIIVGQASQYNATEKYPIKNINLILVKELAVYGLLNATWDLKYRDEFYEVMPKLIKEGKIKYSEHITHGLENAERALLEVLKGDNKGKAVVVLDG